MDDQTIGVLGAGTMGAGIAQVALARGRRVRLFDVAEAGLAKARAGIDQGLGKLVEKGKLGSEEREAALARLLPTTRLEDLADAEVVIEAVPEDLALKRDLLARLEAICAPTALLATNTSSLPVTAIAGGLARPDRVVGLHFFNPAPLMALVEVIRGEATSDAASARAFKLAEDLGKTPILAADTPGFVVNRVARPYYGEALRLVGDHGAAPGEVDRALTACAGFKMGPFALMDLIGIDVNLAVTESVWRAFYDEPRFRPHPLQRRMVDAGRLGRKSGRGFFDPAVAGGASAAAGPAARRLRLVFAGDATTVAAWASRYAAAGHQVDVLGGGPLPARLDGVDGAFELGWTTSADRAERRLRLAMALPPHAWIASDDLAASALEIEAATGRTAWRVGTWPGGHGEDAPGVEVALPEDAQDGARHAAAEAIAALGREAVFVPDLPGLVVPRTLAMLVNEAAFAVEAGVATPEAIDLAMRLGTGYPLGPLAWGDLIGPARVVGLLHVLREAFGERHRAAPWLVRRAAAGLPLVGAAEAERVAY